MNIRCPFCKEKLSISEQELDHAIECPRCRKTFVWAQELQARRDKELARQQRERQIRETHERKKQELEEAKRQKAEKERIEATRIRYYCEVCGKGYAEVDIPLLATRENGKIYCHEHVPKIRPCPACGRDVSRRADSCPHCGEPMTASPEVLPAMPKPPGVRRRKAGRKALCPFCREPIQIGAQKCPHCGEALDKMRRHQKIGKAVKYGAVAAGGATFLGLGTCGLIIVIAIAIVIGGIMLMLL